MTDSLSAPPAAAVVLRDVIESDVPLFFDQQMDPEANHMVAFTAKESEDWAVFQAHWVGFMDDESVAIKTLPFNGQVTGHDLRYREVGRTEVSYWLGKEYWGKGI